MLYLWRHALHAHSSNNAITGTSTSSASCCDEKLAAVTRGVMLARVASHGMSCECWPLLCEFASRSRTACIIHAHRSSLDRKTPVMRWISWSCTDVSVFCCSAAWAVPVGYQVKNYQFFFLIAICRSITFLSGLPKAKRSNRLLRGENPGHKLTPFLPE